LVAEEGGLDIRTYSLSHRIMTQ